MGFKEEFKREMRNVKNDAAKEVDKYWAVDFEGHTIEIHNKMMEETLTVDGHIIDRNTRQSMWSHLIPYSTLSGKFQAADGKVHKIKVKIGGFVRLNITVKVDGRAILQEAVTLEFLPWANKERIVPYLEQQVREHGQIVHTDLPDDAYLYDENHPKLAPGLSDRLLADVVTPFYTKKLIKLFMEQVENPTKQTRKATYEKIQEEKVISYFHELVELFMQEEKDEERVQQEALWLFEHAAHREVVKFAMVILGCTDCEAYKEHLQTVALHEEFTGVALFALRNGTRNANDYTWQLAKTVKCWGKIEAVNFLEPETEEIRQWFLTEGTKNDILNSYSAVVCAEKGRLDVALHEPEISRELFTGASEIIEGLLSEEGHMPIDEYEYAGQVLMRYAYHAKTHCQEPEDFYMLTRIADYLNVDEEAWDERYESNWKPHERRDAEEAIQAIAADPKWLPWALEVLHSDVEDQLQALAIARFYKADITELLFEKLQKEPNRIEYHLALLETKERKTVEALVAFADRFDSLDELTTEEKVTIIVLVEALGEFEGTGEALIERCLRSADVDLQGFALAALSGQDKASWHQPDMVEAVKTVAHASADKENRQFAKSLL
ncbi:MAG: hypothetical protein ACI33P_01325 [Lysinibacillus sp.]